MASNRYFVVYILFSAKRSFDTLDPSWFKVFYGKKNLKILMSMVPVQGASSLHLI